jgi:riboflavin kinase/FMN adenylyltransferase
MTNGAIADNKIIALGFFDGVHLGHGELIKTAKKRSRELGAKPAVLSFDSSPMSVVTGREIALIGNLRERERTLKELYGISEVIIMHFDRAVMEMHWRDFIELLVSRYCAVGFVIGHDFTCGHMGQGSAEKISEYCAGAGLGCDVVPEFKLDGITVSSTYIRELISGGEIERANRFLGRAFSISGEVIHGRGVGGRLGAPTINLLPEPGLVLPARGVYATRVTLRDGRSFNAVTNVGVRPTFGAGGETTVESYIPDFSGELYGEEVTVEFLEFLREERRFESAEELAKQIAIDVKFADNR